MTPLQKIEAVFSIFHDGTITAWSGDKNALTLTIECLYLARRINSSYEKFYLELQQVTTLSLSTWSNPVDLSSEMLTAPDDIFKAELEILSADIKEDYVLVSCAQFDTYFNYCGGNLSLACAEINIFDHDKNQMSFDRLFQVCTDYWDKFNTI